MREQDPRVPVDVEQYLIDLYARAGQMGGASSGPGGGRGGARGGARGATRQRTVVEDRTVSSSTPRPDIPTRVREAFPRAEPLEAQDGIFRVAVPIGMTGLQHVVVDIKSVGLAPEGTDSLLVGTYGKEGLLSRKPTARIADQIGQLLAG